MNLLKSLPLLFVVLFAVNVFSADVWEYDPQTSTAHLEQTHIWFTTGDSTQVGPELYVNDTNSEFFGHLNNFINKAIKKNKKRKFNYEEYTSQNNGTYNCIVPES